MQYDEIPEYELKSYYTRLVPQLLRRRAGEWVRIDTIAHDCERFVAIVQCLADHGVFDNRAGFCMIELSTDHTAVRLTPDSIRHRHEPQLQWKFQ